MFISFLSIYLSFYIIFVVATFWLIRNSRRRKGQILGVVKDKTISTSFGNEEK